MKKITSKSWVYFKRAILIETALDPHQLLTFLQIVEMNLGRLKDKEKWGPRIIDLDIIFFGDQIINSDDLTIPHPLMHERLFVLDPVVDVAPDWIHPIIKKSVMDIRADLLIERDA